MITLFHPLSLHRLMRPLRSIKARLTLCASLALTASVALTTVVLEDEAERQTVIAHQDRELNEGVRAAGVLSRRVVQLQRALADTAMLVDETLLADRARLHQFVAAQPVLRGLFSNIFVAGQDGLVQVFADSAGIRHPTLSVADRLYFQRTLAEQRPIISDVLPGRVSGEPIITFTVPLRKGDRVYGVLGGALRLASRDMLDDLVEGSDTQNEALVIVTDLRGVVLAHPDRSRILQSLTAEPRMAQAYDDWVAAGSAVEPAGQFLQQPGQVLSATGVAGPDWLLWRAVPQAELLAPLRAARQKALLTASAIVGLASLVVLGLISWLLRPLQQLQRRAENLFDDRSDVHAGWPAVGGEIGELSRVLRHVSAERAQFERFNAEVMAQLGSVMAAAPVGILFARAQRLQLVSAEMCRLVQHDEPALLGQPLATLFATPDDFPRLQAQVAEAFGRQQPYVGEWQLQRADGSAFWAQLRGQPVNAADAGAGTIWTVADVSDVVQARGELEWSATHDALTGLGNRKLFEQRMQHLLAHRPASLPAALVMLDLDRFKPVNDTAGHAIGDEMLRQVAAAITSQVRSADLVARIGGDEFALLLENCPPDAARRITGNVHEAIAAIRLPWQERLLEVGASMGVASLQADTPDAAAWLQRADAACYAAKAAGRGRVTMATA